MRIEQLMKQQLRETDIFARIGGDEFAALFSNTSFATARQVVTRLEYAVANHNQHSGCYFEIAFSYGFIGFDPNVHDSVDALIADGDTHMHVRKRAKKQAETVGSTFG